MENLNLPPFLPGDKVIYITGISMPKNSIHTVSDVWQNKCGCWVIAINNVEPIIEFINYPSCLCTSCNKVYASDIYLDKTSWVAKSFRKVQEQKFLAVSFEKIMEETEKICVN